MKSESRNSNDLGLVIKEKSKSIEENVSKESWKSSDSRNFSLFSSDNEKISNVLRLIENKISVDGTDNGCVISIIGKSSLNAFNSKANYVPDWVDQNIFDSRSQDRFSLFEDNFIQIDGCYDINNRMVLLHLTSVFDTWAALKIFENLEKKIIEKGFLSILPDLLSDLFKSLLLLFYVSDIIIVTNPAPRFDISIINILRIINSTRTKLQPFVAEMLSNLDKNLLNYGKNPSLPEILFLFEAYNGYDFIKESNVKQYIKQLEQQILRLLRKTKLINSLFTISSLNSFVFVATESSRISDYDEYFSNEIFRQCGFDDNDLGNYYLDPDFTKEKNDERTFSKFIQPHLNSVNKHSSKEQSSSRSIERNRTKLFCKTFLAFKNLIFLQKYSGISSEKKRNLQKILDSLSFTLDVDNRFSEARCQKMVSTAVEFYKENLPSHYNQATHEHKLMLALQHFTTEARGPALYKYIQIIQNDCIAFWSNGRKMCEELSLTGNNCCNKLHRLPHDDFIDQQETTIAMNENNNLPILTHNSMVKLISACDCGRRQANRDDPFTTKNGNYDFYLKMRFKCHTCRSIVRYNFNVYKSNFDLEAFSSSQNMTSKSENQDSPLTKLFSDLNLTQDSDSEHKNDSEIVNNDLSDDENLSINGDSISYNNDDSDNNENSDKSKVKQTDSSLTSKEKVRINSRNCSNEKSRSSSTSQSSDGDDFFEKNFSSDEELIENLNESQSPIKEILDVKVLPPMINTLCADNVPARFASWSLVCFGSSSIYSHNLGLQDQQGFIKGSHYLLPWNVTVFVQHSNRAPLWEGKRPRGIKHKRTVKDGTRFTVKVFLGVEYECLKGHRFICSGPDQVHKASTFKFKETADIVAKNDMPLYIQCICSRSDKICMAQLMRIHVVTPKAPVHVTLNPMVQVTPNSNLLFYPGNRSPIKLSQSSYWVLRLPMIYETCNGPLRFPNQESPPYCRLLKGCYDVAENQKKQSIT
ncbi:SMG8-like protein [Sarcoptes scabiei]|uniref:Nonsense-mediated mRNA decay factor SMG8 n=1 Tax=Sarcoptes scabiei TaxID=52283 RepID=A0A132AHK7_SARSC|nr:SMG8-like protein [Sarcoptes scabiei]